jgi:hypothetical protein
VVVQEVVVLTVLLFPLTLRITAAAAVAAVEVPGVLEIMGPPAILEAVVILVILEHLGTLETRATKVLLEMAVILAVQVPTETPGAPDRAEILEIQGTPEQLTPVILGRRGQQQLILALL